MLYTQQGSVTSREMKYHTRHPKYERRFGLHRPRIKIHMALEIYKKKIVVYRVAPTQKHILIHEFPELLVRGEGGSCPSARSIFHIFRHLITCGRSTCIADREREPRPTTTHQLEILVAFVMARFFSFSVSFFFFSF